MVPVDIVEADLARREHQQAIVELIDAYAADPMGNGKPLSAEISMTWPFCVRFAGRGAVSSLDSAWFLW